MSKYIPVSLLVYHPNRMLYFKKKSRLNMPEFNDIISRKINSLEKNQAIRVTNNSFTERYFASHALPSR